MNHHFMSGVIALISASVSTAADSPALAREGLARHAETELRENILPFWLQHTRNKATGGFHGAVTRELKVVPGEPRGALLTSRILWTFAAASRRYNDPAYREMATWAYRDLLDHFWDPENGGLFWSITADGAPLDTRKHLYGQVFGIYALSEYHRMCGDQVALDRAIAIYRAMEEHTRDRAHGGYFEENDRAWQRRTDIEPRERLMGGNAPKSQNAHLHIMEAYTNLLRVWPDPGLRADLRDLAEVMLTRVLNPATHHLRLFLDDDWTPRSDEISFGHDIEFSWLIGETADVVGDAELIARARPEALAISDACLREGIDADGGMFNEAGPQGLIDPRKDWWQQAESAVGFVNAWQLSGEPRFLAAAQHTWSFIDRCLVNHETGEWFQSTDRAGHPDRDAPLAHMWKCPYHNSRACLETIERMHDTAAEGETPAAQ